MLVFFQLRLEKVWFGRNLLQRESRILMQFSLISYTSYLIERLKRSDNLRQRLIAAFRYPGIGKINKGYV